MTRKNRERKHTDSKSSVLRRHIETSHTEWAAQAAELDNELIESYHRADHIYCVADKNHKHQDIHRPGKPHAEALAE